MELPDTAERSVRRRAYVAALLSQTLKCQVGTATMPYWAVDPKSFFVDPDPVVFLHEDPNPALKKTFKNNLMKSFLLLKKRKRLLKSKKQKSLCKFSLKI